MVDLLDCSDKPGNVVYISISVYGQISAVSFGSLDVLTAGCIAPHDAYVIEMGIAVKPLEDGDVAALRNDASRAGAESRRTAPGISMIRRAPSSPKNPAAGPVY